MASNVHQSFYAQISHRFGSNATKLLKSYARNNQHLGNMTNGKDFLIKCRRTGIMPSHIVRSLKCVRELLATGSPMLGKLSRVTANFQKSILNLEIKDTYYRLKSLHAQLSSQKQQIREQIDQETYNYFCFTQEFAYHSHFRRKQQQINRKYTRLMSTNVSRNEILLPSKNDRAILNATGKIVPPETMILLSLGPKFSLPYTSLTQVPFFHLIADVENILSPIQDREIVDQTRGRIINIIQNYINRNKRGNSNDPLVLFCKQATTVTRNFIKRNPDVLIMEADKGNRTVIMDLQDYNTKMENLVGDTTVYETLNRDPTGKYQRRNNDFAKRLYDLKLIDWKTKYKLSNNSAYCPRIYGQPKAHKPGLPLRPVVPNVTSPTYHLSKYIANILQSGFSSSFNIKDSYEFCNYVNGLQIPPDYLLVSFDVVSLFTNIPIDLVRQGIFAVWTEVAAHTKINLDLFMEMVEFCVDASYFCFRGKFFHQKFGTAMGSPLSPILADIVMEGLILWAVRTTDIPTGFIRKYVDDLFIIIHKDQIQTTLDTFNQYNQHLQFTCEIEADRKLPFLDLMVVRTEDNTLKTDWYAKPISSGRLLNFHSFHPFNQKMGVITGFINRVQKFSTVNTTSEQNQLIRAQLSKNDYPKQLINRLLHRSLLPSQPPPTFPPPPPPPSPPPLLSAPMPIASAPPDREPAKYRSIPYIHTLSTEIKTVLQNINPAIKITARSMNNTKRLYPTPKDPVLPLHKYNLIYKLPCLNCQACYVGMTTNNLKTRIAGHQTTINSLENKLNAGHQYNDTEIQQLKGKTALVEHCIDHQHRFNLQNPQILDHTFKKSSLPVLEMCYIATTPNTVNHRTDTDHLSRSYSNVIGCLSNRERIISQSHSSITPHTTSTSIGG